MNSYLPTTPGTQVEFTVDRPRRPRLACRFRIHRACRRSGWSCACACHAPAIITDWAAGQ